MGTPNRFGIDLGLGTHQHYPDHYSPELLQPIARTTCREHLGCVLPFLGEDIWTAYELSWLDTQGKPQVALAEFRVDAASPYLIESKSFKYYLNSFNQTEIDRLELEQRLAQDLSHAAQGAVSVELQPLDATSQVPQQLVGFECIDTAPFSQRRYHPAPELLVGRPNNSVSRWCSHLLKTNCPVTGQPDWASIYIELDGATIAPEDLLAYVVSFRQHQDFHENCVEQIYTDLWTRLSPHKLWVYARYTRRGGLDINPFRTSHPLKAPNLRTVRQ
jgi:7-cyano-7-deazaguanine reductase